MDLHLHNLVAAVESRPFGSPFAYLVCLAMFSMERKESVLLFLFLYDESEREEEIAHVRMTVHVSCFFKRRKI